MSYQTKKSKVNSYISRLIKASTVEGKTELNKNLVIGTTCIELGISENDVLESLGYFEKANYLKVTEDEIILY